MDILPVSAIVPTRNRAKALLVTLNSLKQQQVFPAELIVVDASDDATTKEMLSSFAQEMSSSCSIQWIEAKTRGAAAQRNQGVILATQPVVWFFDDDILLEPECATRLWQALSSDPKLGGVNAMIINQKYHPPGRASRTLFRLLHGHAENTYAGLVIGPAVNLLPEDRDDLPEVVAVEWLNTTCTLYRREALPNPTFDHIFVGYSIMEDLALSLRVGQKWHLANARTARIFHDSQPGTHKSDVSAVAAMELVNRHYVMTEILGRQRLLDHLRLFVSEVFQLGICTARAQSRKQLLAKCRGKLRGLGQIYKKFVWQPSLSESSKSQADVSVRDRMQNL